jgi:prolipoprotein diacylglyceryltransferase
VGVSKDPWLQAAEWFDTWRVIPRLVLFLYAAFVYKVTFFILTWYIHQPAVDRGTEESAVVIGIFTAVTGLASYVFKVYSDGGRDWDKMHSAGSDTSRTS